MRYESFTVENFKGIQSLKLELDRKPYCPVLTLVGLNESGKTTILEAIDWLRRPTKYSEQHIIPKHQLANFNGKIEVGARLKLTDTDKSQLMIFLEKKDFKVASIGDFCTISRAFTYKDSETVAKKTYVTVPVTGRKKRGKTDKAIEKWPEIAQDMRNFVNRDLVPQIVYYENFLFDIPDKIYLKGSGLEKKNQAQYRSVIQDVLTAVDGEMTIEKHLVDRFENRGLNAIDIFSDDKISAVLNKAEGHITRTVIDSWKDIIAIKGRGLSITFGRGLSKDDEGIYLQIKVKEGGRDYSVSERSLGFRWFLAFLFFTHYRGYREDGKGGTLFLLDEPASNLHPSAQSKLLKEFARLPKKQTVIYSTHSHHMIEPEWLHNTYIVSNKAMDYSNVGFDYTDDETAISANRYFPYVSQDPNDTDLFRPILDALDYQPSKLEMVPPLVITEGKNDFYGFKYFAEGLGDAELNIYPSTGKDKTEYAASLYLAWGKPFIIMLDGDGWR